MKKIALSLLPALLAAAPGLQAADRTVTVRFEAVVGSEKFACGASYRGIGTTNSTISPRDFRFYVHGLELIGAGGKSVPVALDQDGKWQTDDVALLDFENATGGCANGTPDVNAEIRGTVPEGDYTGLRFTMGVPFTANHGDLTAQPSPLNLTALFWSWNAGHKFARLDFSSTGLKRGFLLHLGSTGCTPNKTRITVPTQCRNLNEVNVEFADFDPATDVVTADLAAVLRDTNVDENQEDTASGCMSAPNDNDCAALFANFGLPFGDRAAGGQKFFRRTSPRAASSGNE